MGQRIGAAKSAQLLGISRHELQRLIRRGELRSFDGELDLDELKRLYPQLALHGPPALDEAYFIRKTAFSRRVRETVIPDTDSLLSQLKRRNTDLAVQRGKAERYHEVITAMMAKLAQLQQSDDERCRQIAAELNLWLLELLEKPEE